MDIGLEPVHIAAANSNLVSVIVNLIKLSYDCIITRRKFKQFGPCNSTIDCVGGNSYLYLFHYWMLSCDVCLSQRQGKAEETARGENNHLRRD